MFCKDCGKEIPNDSNMCPYCGTSVWERPTHASSSPSACVSTPTNSTPQAREDVYATPPVYTNAPANNAPPAYNNAPVNNAPPAYTNTPTNNVPPPYAGNTPQNYSQPSSAKVPKSLDKEFILKNINTIFAIISVVLLFLPMLTVNAFELGYSNKFTITGFDLAGGVVFSDYSTLDRNFFAWLMFVIPVFAVLSNYIKKLFPIKKIMLFVAPLICGVCEFFAKASASSGMSVSLSTAVGFYIYLLVCIVWLIVGYLQYKNIPLNKDSITNMLDQKKQ